MNRVIELDRGETEYQAQAETVLRLAKTLGCRMEDLYEITV